ncbi:MAG TPA: DUF3175 domain-containing protein [Steroidobacteraceae bacterium]|nr:DUF3175 domain-containing protein [Steroidobacteraceae bacterium]
MAAKPKRKASKTAKKRTRKPAKRPQRKWSGRVTQTSDALTLDQGVFTRSDPKSISRSLKRSADKSKRRKGTPFQSAMSMLNFYINRAGKDLGAGHKRTLERAKEELRALYGREKKAAGTKRKA